MLRSISPIAYHRLSREAMLERHIDQCRSRDRHRSRRYRAQYSLRVASGIFGVWNEHLPTWFEEETLKNENTEKLKYASVRRVSGANQRICFSDRSALCAIAEVPQGSGSLGSS